MTAIFGLDRPAMGLRRRRSLAGRRWRNRLVSIARLRSYNLYGPTETPIRATHDQYDGDLWNGARSPWASRSATPAFTSWTMGWNRSRRARRGSCTSPAWDWPGAT